MSPWCVLNVVMVFFNFYENFSKSKFWPTCTLMHRWCCRWCRFCYTMLCAGYILVLLMLWRCSLSTLRFTFMLLCALCYYLYAWRCIFFVTWSFLLSYDFIEVFYLCFCSLFGWTKWFQISNKLRKMCANWSNKFFSLNLWHAPLCI